MVLAQAFAISDSEVRGDLVVRAAEAARLQSLRALTRLGITCLLRDLSMRHVRKCTAPARFFKSPAELTDSPATEWPYCPTWKLLRLLQHPGGGCGRRRKPVYSGDRLCQHTRQMHWLGGSCSGTRGGRCLTKKQAVHASIVTIKSFQSDWMTNGRPSTRDHGAQSKACALGACGTRVTCALVAMFCDLPPPACFGSPGGCTTPEYLRTFDFLQRCSKSLCYLEPHSQIRVIARSCNTRKRWALRRLQTRTR